MKFSDFFRADSPLSSTRLGTIGSIILFIPCFVASWTWLSLSKGALQEIPNSVMVFLTVLITGKIAGALVEAGTKILGNKPDA